MRADLTGPTPWVEMTGRIDRRSSLSDALSKIDALDKLEETGVYGTSKNLPGEARQGAGTVTPSLERKFSKVTSTKAALPAVLEQSELEAGEAAEDQGSDVPCGSSL
jgi:hypothetical protein